MKRLLVDFNSIQNGALRALQRHASSPLREGEIVRMSDEEEHGAQGIVVRVKGDLVYVAIDWKTWGPITEIATSHGSSVPTSRSEASTTSSHAGARTSPSAVFA
jgi:hypothetical protein